MKTAEDVLVHKLAHERFAFPSDIDFIDSILLLIEAGVIKIEYIDKAEARLCTNTEIIIVGRSKIFRDFGVLLNNQGTLYASIRKIKKAK